MNRERIVKSSGNVFKDLGFEDIDAQKLQIKSSLMMQIEQYIKEERLTQARAGTAMGVSRPRISDLMRGQIQKFTIDALVDMLARVGHELSIQVKRAA